MCRKLMIINRFCAFSRFFVLRKKKKKLHLINTTFAFTRHLHGKSAAKKKFCSLSSGLVRVRYAGARNRGNFIECVCLCAHHIQLQRV